MKKLLMATALLVASAGVFSFTKFADTFTVDTAKSKVEWSGSAADHYHPGTVAIKSGTVMVDNGKITGGKFVMDLTTIKSTDGTGDRLDGHLKSPQFFDAAKFGDATFEITSVNYTSDNTADISGTLNVKGANVPVKFPAKIRGLKDGKLFAEASFSLDPVALNIMKYGVDVTVHLFAAK